MKINRSYLVEVNLPTLAAGQRYQFQNIPDLDQRAVIYGIETFTSSQQAVSPQQKNVVTSAGAANITLTLVIGNNEEVYQFPYLDMNPATNSGFIRWFEPRLVNISKSYITINGTAGLTAAESALFNFIYNPR